MVRRPSLYYIQGCAASPALVRYAVSPEFSPDGNWLAYVSRMNPARHEVYAQPYPGQGERHLMSNNGGEQPAWGPMAANGSMCNASLER